MTTSVAQCASAEPVQAVCAGAAATPSAVRQVRCVERGRLAYYRARADVAFWDAHWGRELWAVDYGASREGKLGYFERIFPRHLPRRGRILEAGCGLGHVVVGLRARGYDCEGVDYSTQTVERVRAALPDVPIRTADVLALNVPDGHYAAYISLGVIEHRQAGPEPFLREAHRVLAGDGVLLVSVPHFHVLRRLKSALGFYRGDPRGLQFYQYAYSAEELARVLASCGFRVIARYGYDSWKGLKDEIPLALRLFAFPRVGPWLDRAWRRSLWARRHVGHMTLFVCRKMEARR